jgi:hypothetical protein
VKLTGQSPGLPGNEISFRIVPLDPARLQGGAYGALSGQMIIFIKWNPLTPILPAPKKGKEDPFPSRGEMTKYYTIFEEISFY